MCQCEDRSCQREGLQVPVWFSHVCPPSALLPGSTFSSFCSSFLISHSPLVTAACSSETGNSQGCEDERLREWTSISHIFFLLKKCGNPKEAGVAPFHFLWALFKKIYSAINAISSTAGLLILKPIARFQIAFYFTNASLRIKYKWNIEAKNRMLIPTPERPTILLQPHFSKVRSGKLLPVGCSCIHRQGK